MSTVRAKIEASFHSPDITHITGKSVVHYIALIGQRCNQLMHDYAEDTTALHAHEREYKSSPESINHSLAALKEVVDGLDLQMQENEDIQILEEILLNIEKQELKIAEILLPIATYEEYRIQMKALRQELMEKKLPEIAPESMRFFFQTVLTAINQGMQKIEVAQENLAKGHHYPSGFDIESKIDELLFSKLRLREMKIKIDELSFSRSLKLKMDAQKREQDAEAKVSKHTFIKNEAKEQPKPPSQSHKKCVIQ